MKRRECHTRKGRRMTHPMTVLVLAPSAGGYYFGELLAGLTREVAGADGWLVLVQTLEVGTRSDEASEPGDFTTPIAWSKVDAVVSITTAVRGSYLQRLRDAGKPVMLASTRMPDFDAPVALPDNHGGPSPQWSTSSALDQYAPTR